MALVFIPQVLTHLLAPILPYIISLMPDGIGVKYGIFGIFDINDAFGNHRLKWLDMAIWVSKDASGPQECRPMPLNNFWIALKLQIAKYWLSKFSFEFFRISFVFLKCFGQSGEAFPETFVYVFGLSEIIEHTSRGGLIDFQYFQIFRPPSRLYPALSGYIQLSWAKWAILGYSDYLELSLALPNYLELSWTTFLELLD